MKIDFYLHLLASTTIFLIFKDLVGITKSILITLSIGVLKEVFDYSNNQPDFDYVDWIGDIVGTAFGVLSTKIKDILKYINLFNFN